MAKQPHNEHELELALTRLAGNNIAAVKLRHAMSAVILAQMLPDGCVVKGGTSLRLRLGPNKSRMTVDFDAARNTELEDFLKALRANLETGWNGFTGGDQRSASVKPRVRIMPFCVLGQSVWFPCCGMMTIRPSSGLRYLA